MGLTKDQIRRAIDECSDMGHEITIKDITYFILKREYQDGVLAFNILFDGVLDMTQAEYENLDEIKFLREYMNSNFVVKRPKNSNSRVDFSDISFEENKDALIKLLEEVKSARMNGTIEYKDAIKIETDIRTKLNDKFNVSESVNEQQIIVTKKFDYICPYLNKECWVQTKEDAMKRFNLVEKQ